MIKPYTISRTRLLDDDRCSRYEYWRYEHASKGVDAPGDALSRARGIALHQGLANLSLSIKDQKNPMQVFMGMVEGRDPQVWEFDPRRTLKEHQFLIEVSERVMLPAIKAKLEEEFHIVSVEQEHRIPLLDETYEDVAEYSDGHVIKWYSREDGILDDKDDSSHWVHSFKTVEKYQPWLHGNNAKWAMQNVSEPWAVMNDKDPNVIGVKEVRGVVMVWMESGKLTENKGDGHYSIDSPLVNPYCDGGRYYAQYRWQDSQGNPCQVPRGAKRVPVYDKMKLSEWLALLKNGEVVGFNPRTLFYGPNRFVYPRERTKDWLTQVRFRAMRMEARAKEAALFLEKGNTIEWRNALNKNFPMSEQHCGRCPYTDLCYGGDTGLMQIGAGKYTIRTDRSSDKAHVEVKEVEGIPG